MGRYDSVRWGWHKPLYGPARNRVLLRPFERATRRVRAARIRGSSARPLTSFERGGIVGSMPLLDGNIRIPRGSERFLALQRTAYQHPVNRLFRRLRLARLYDRFLLPVIEARRTETLASSYQRDLEEEYRSFSATLPANAKNVLDIGCGIAGIDLFLYRHYHGAIDLHLLDKDGTSEIYYDFEQQGAFYNSLSLARTFLTMNGLPESRVHAYEATRDGFPKHPKFDLVISLISWGFHYPISTYGERVRESLAPEGRLILDVRRGTGGREDLRGLFGTEPKVLLASPKFERLSIAKAAIN